ncbi:tRNA1(Val) (adenine(37)-N6)-methyltransferase [Hugenholtzia roseola]|uniref:tRNA1(Val) (adenine(37)-N6)-methyltransferase n=1 Tax=Hugenholtzia roseola TaxID=1002 RepID=UPI000419A838|nr:methyltransferase [Hugenholtzia roseola]
MFAFKKFRIYQEKVGMKVCTDACILGAWSPLGSARRILDIGTGTGLLALMLAQRSSPLTEIEAVEFEATAYFQALQNVQHSPFAHKIRLFHTPIQAFKPAWGYDFIIVNPPFFQNHTPAQDKNRHLALHNESLPFQDLLASLVRLLQPQGKAAILLPPYESQFFATQAAEYGLEVCQKLVIFQNPEGKAIRQIQILKRKESFVSDSNIKEDFFYIHQEKAARPLYTEQMQLLLKDFYLIF